MVASFIQERIWRTVRAGEEAAMAWTHWPESPSQTCQVGWTHPLPPSVPPCRQWHFTSRSLDATLIPKKSCGLCRCLLFAKLMLSCGLNPCCSSSSCLEGNPSPSASAASGDLVRTLEDKGLWTSQQWRILSPKFLVCFWNVAIIWVCFEGGKLIQNSTILEFSDEDTSFDVSTTDNSYWTVCGAHTEEDLAQPSLNLPWMQHPCLIIAGASSHQR